MVYERTLEAHGNGQTKFSFLSPISYCFRGTSGDGQSTLVVKLGVSPSQFRLLTGPQRYHPWIVQHAQGRSAEMAVSPHHNNQSTNIGGAANQTRLGSCILRGNNLEEPCLVHVLRG
jgi:hypothetical protein